MSGKKHKRATGYWLHIDDERLEYKKYLTATVSCATMEVTVPSTGDELITIECKVEHTTAKAWLIIDNMSGNQGWLPKSIGNLVQDVDPDGNSLFTAPEWWCKRNRFI
jgi:hypothetical protein